MSFPSNPSGLSSWGCFWVTLPRREGHSSAPTSRESVSPLMGLRRRAQSAESSWVGIFKTQIHLSQRFPKLFTNSSPPFSTGQHLPMPDVQGGPEEPGKTELGKAPSVKGWVCAAPNTRNTRLFPALFPVS